MRNEKNLNGKYHFFALICILIWGTTFVSTKILLRYMDPVQIMFFRFLIGYVCLFLLCPKIQIPKHFTEEIVLIGAGVFGGTLYYLLENYAVEYTYASNVSLIITTAPLLTAILMHFSDRTEPLKARFFYGFLLALAGVALIVLNGSFTFHVRVWGDLLTLLAALSWALYTLCVKKIPAEMSALQAVRRIFFYSLCTALPFFCFHLDGITTALQFPLVWLHLFFLGALACSLCYVLWNRAVEKLGAVQSGNYIYLIPIVTLAISALFLGEPLGVYNIGGCILIILGVFLSSFEKRC